jgi:hypothetical protein
LSSDAETQLIDLLRTWRHPDRPLEPNSIPSRPSTTVSNHEQRRSERVWCKAFLQAHERQWLSSQLNPLKSSHNNNTPSDTTITPLPSHTNKNSTCCSESSGAVANPPASEKVRLILVEAVHINSKKQNSKNTTNNKDWKEGTVRKTVVLERGGGNLEELFRVSKAKLRLKKAPQRCFMMIVEQTKTTEIDISHLGAIPDGSTLHVSCHSNIDSKQQPKKTPTTDHASGDSKSTMTSSMSMDDDVYVPPAPSTPDDPLARVKQVYADRQRRHKQSIGMPATNCPMTTNDIQAQNNTESNSQSKLSFEERLKQLEPLSGSRANLPAAAHREEILTKLEQQSRVLIVSGQTGSGKSTQVPQYLLEFDQHAKICVTQPRRVAAMSLADRVSSERGNYPPGHAKSAVGYQVRLSSAVHPTSTRLIYCTVGILVRMLLQSSPNHKDDDTGINIPCREWTHIVIDEVHERDVSTDFLLLLLKMVLHANPNVRLILMSATVSADQWVRYFASHKPQLVQIAGRTFPVQTNWLEDCQAFCGKSISSWNNNPRSDPNKEENPLLSPRAMERIDNPFICSLVARIIENQQSVAKEDQDRSMGAILIFLPGKSEIDS